MINSQSHHPVPSSISTLDLDSSKSTPTGMRDGDEAPSPVAGTRPSRPSLLDNNAEAGPSRPRRKRQRIEKGPRGFDWYYADISSHISASRLNATGQYGALGVSIYPPGLTTWTRGEKGTFFASLARHSRLRPDLIAEEVGKTQAEVQIYLDCLAYAVRTLNRRRGSNDDSTRWRDRVFDSGAIEVDDAWAALEDQLGEAVEQAVARVTAPAGYRSDLARWGEQIGPEQLYDIDAALKDDELVILAEAREAEIEEHEPDPFEQDNIEIEQLQEIPKRERNPEEKKRLRTLLTRRSARQAYRRKRLLEQGWTEEKIEQAGGPDGAFTLTTDKDKVLKQVIGMRTGLEAKKEEEGAAEPVDPDVVKMRDVGVRAHVTKLGWDVFDFSRIAELMELVRERTGAAANTVSFELIAHLYAELLVYLKPLVYETILLAEQQALLTGSDEIDVEHVHEARALRGEPRPYAILADIVNGWVAAQRQENGDSTPAPGSPVPSNTPRARSPAPTPMASPRPLSRAATPTTPSARSDPASPQERHDDLPPWSSFWGLEPHVEDDAPETVPESTETDDEDEAMDDALDEADTELDKVVMKELWAAVDEDNPDKVIDTTPWLEDVPDGDVDADDEDPADGAIRTSDRPKRKRRRIAAALEELDERDALTDLLHAQEAYRSLAVNAETARRQRRYRRLMSESMSMVRKRKERRKHYKSNVDVHDGDSDLLLTSDDDHSDGEHSGNEDGEIDFEQLDPSGDESDGPPLADEFNDYDEEGPNGHGDAEDGDSEQDYAPTPMEPKHAPTPRETKPAPTPRETKYASDGSDSEDDAADDYAAAAPTPREVKPALTPRDENDSESDSDEGMPPPVETQPESVHSPSDHDMESIHSASDPESIEEPGTFADDNRAADDDDVESASDESD